MRQVQSIVAAVCVAALFLPGSLKSNSLVFYHSPVASFRIAWPKPTSFEAARTQFTYSWVLADLLNRETRLAKWKCSALTSSSFDLTGEWLDKSAPTDGRKIDPAERRRQAQVCLEEMSQLLRELTPTYDQVETVRLTTLEKWRGRLILREPSGNNATVSVDHNERISKSATTVARERVERERALVAARLALSEALPDEWPSKAMYAVVAEDFAHVTSEGFLAWLHSLKSARQLTVQIKDDPELPHFAAAPFSTRARASEVFEVYSTGPLVGTQYVLVSFELTYSAPLNSVVDNRPAICKASGIAPQDTRGVKCTVLHWHPGVRLLVVYFAEPDKLDRAKAIAALRDLAKHDDFKRLGEGGAPYGLGKPLQAVVGH